MGRAPAGFAEDKLEQGLQRKGAWTAEEDEKLVAFIKENNGHGSWRTLPKLAGLERCGKSCRLRWTNYLRPNIKRGDFSAEEESSIIQLHALVGNKWSSIASHLVGRTDNEVKNHWNTRLKKKLTKMGIDPATHLPLSFFPSHYHLYGNLSGCNQQSSYLDSSSSWQKVLLQRSLEVNPTIACHLVQWELARLEAEARQKLVTASHGTTHVQNYAAWLQSLQQNQDSQNHNENLFKNKNFSSCEEGKETSPSNKECLALNKEEIGHICEDHVLTSTTNSIGTPDTCSSSDSLSSNLLSSDQFLIPDDLISLDLPFNESYNSSTDIGPHERSPISLDDYATHQHDSYWNRMLNLLGHVTFENI